MLTSQELINEIYRRINVIRRDGYEVSSVSLGHYYKYCLDGNTQVAIDLANPIFHKNRNRFGEYSCKSLIFGVPLKFNYRNRCSIRVSRKLGKRYKVSRSMGWGFDGIDEYKTHTYYKYGRQKNQNLCKMPITTI